MKVDHRGPAARSGLTMVELAIVTAIGVTIMGTIFAIWIGASRSSRMTGAHLEAMQSVLIASHALRTDLARMLYTHLVKDGQIQPGNLRIDPNGVSLEFHVPRNLDTENWKMDLEPVTYHLEPVPDAAGSYRLVRKDAGDARALTGCYLGGIHFQFLPEGTAAPHRMFLQVTLEGLDQPRPAARFAASLLIPVYRTLPPAAFLVDPGGFRQPLPDPRGGP